MSQSRIGSLALHIRADHAQGELSTQCQVLARQVLNRVVDSLDQTDRVVLIRRLDIRWRLPARALGTADTVERLAADLIAALEPAWATPCEPPDHDADVVVFADTAAWWASALTAHAVGRIGWYHQALLASEPLLALADPAHRPLALAVLRQLGPRAVEVLRRSPPDALHACATALEIVVPRVLTSTTPQPGSGGGDDEKTAEAAAVKLVRQVLHQSRAGAGTGTGTDTALLGLGALALHLDRAPPHACPEVEALRFSAALAAVAAKTGKHTATKTTLPRPDRAPAEDRHFEATAHAGLFYLATLLLELETGEHLWAACVPDAQLLSWAAAGLVGDDPVARWFGGSDAAMPTVTPAQADEVIGKGCIALARALARQRPDFALPPLELTLDNGWLVATLPNSVFPVWSTVCTDPTQLREAASTLSVCWPEGLIIPPAWLELGLRGRFTPQTDYSARTLFRLKGPEAVARLASAALGSAAALFESRVGEDCLTSAAAFVERWLRLGGRLDDRPEDHPETLVVRLRATDLSFPIRRAGLDRDPGFLPWLGRTVVFRFEGDEPERDELPIVSDPREGGQTHPLR